MSSRSNGELVLTKGLKGQLAKGHPGQRDVTHCLGESKEFRSVVANRDTVGRRAGLSALKSFAPRVQCRRVGSPSFLRWSLWRSLQPNPTKYSACSSSDLGSISPASVALHGPGFALSEQHHPFRSVRPSSTHARVPTPSSRYTHLSRQRFLARLARGKRKASLTLRSGQRRRGAGFRRHPGGSCLQLPISTLRGYWRRWWPAPFDLA